MRNKINKFFVIVNAVILLVMFYSPAVIIAQIATPPSGGGTISNPYLIESLNNLYWVSQNSSSWHSYFKQTADIDASSTSGWDNGKGFSPIGNSSHKFTGHYNGNGYVIKSLFINRPTYSSSVTTDIGLFGYNGSTGQINNVWLENVNITGYYYVGGVAGYNDTGYLTGCYVSGNIIGDTYVGGIAGYNVNNGSVGGDITFCASTANVKGTDTVGGLVGANDSGTITNCYSAGSVSGTSHLGGLVDLVVAPGKVDSSFWDTETSGQSSSGGGTGKTTAVMQTITLYADAGWLIGGSGDNWGMSPLHNDGYPFINTQGYANYATKPVGDGSSANPYQIATLANLYWVDINSSSWGTNVYFKQTANIDATDTQNWCGGKGFQPIGNTSIFFEARYNGNGHTINKLYINRQTLDRLGLFGTIGFTSIDKLGVTNVNINGGTSAIGGVLGVDRNSTISECYSTGSITSNGTEVGGIIGYNNSNCTVSDCYSTISISGSGNTYVGGLVGINYTNGTSSDCYSTGPVTSSATYLGGFCGRNIGTITGGFWNTDIVATGIGTGTTTGATGENTAGMKSGSTYLNAGWDTSVWYRDDSYNNSEPYLYWQNPGGSPLPVELSSFTATVNNNKVELKWETATELNNYGFEIEKLETSKVKSEMWETIGFVEGSGNSNSPKEYSFTDPDLPKVDKVSYRLKQIDNDGQYKYSNIINVNVDNVPTEFTLEQNFPNPFNPTTTIHFALPANSNVTLAVYNSIGQKVTDLVNGELPAGNHTVNFNASRLSSGVYIDRLEAVPLTASKSSSAAFSQTKKMELLK